MVVQGVVARARWRQSTRSRATARRPAVNSERSAGSTWKYAPLGAGSSGPLPRSASGSTARIFARSSASLIAPTRSSQIQCPRRSGGDGHEHGLRCDGIRSVEIERHAGRFAIGRARFPSSRRSAALPAAADRRRRSRRRRRDSHSPRPAHRRTLRQSTERRGERETARRPGSAIGRPSPARCGQRPHEIRDPRPHAGHREQPVLDRHGIGRRCSQRLRDLGRLFGRESKERQHHERLGRACALAASIRPGAAHRCAAPSRSCVPVSSAGSGSVNAGCEQIGRAAAAVLGDLRNDSRLSHETIDDNRRHRRGRRPARPLECRTAPGRTARGATSSSFSVHAGLLMRGRVRFERGAQRTERREHILSARRARRLKVASRLLHTIGQVLEVLQLRHARSPNPSDRRARPGRRPPRVASRRRALRATA